MQLKGLTVIIRQLWFLVASLRTQTTAS